MTQNLDTLGGFTQAAETVGRHSTEVMREGAGQQASPRHPWSSGKGQEGGQSYSIRRPALPLKHHVPPGGSSLQGLSNPSCEMGSTGLPDSSGKMLVSRAASERPEAWRGELGLQESVTPEPRVPASGWRMLAEWLGWRGGGPCRAQQAKEAPSPTYQAEGPGGSWREALGPKKLPLSSVTRKDRARAPSPGPQPKSENMPAVLPHLTSPWRGQLP